MSTPRKRTDGAEPAAGYPAEEKEAKEAVVSQCNYNFSLLNLEQGDTIANTTLFPSGRLLVSVRSAKLKREVLTLLDTKNPERLRVLTTFPDTRISNANNLSLNLALELSNGNLWISTILDGSLYFRLFDNAMNEIFHTIRNKKQYQKAVIKIASGIEIEPDILLLCYADGSLSFENIRTGTIWITRTDKKFPWAKHSCSVLLCGTQIRSLGHDGSIQLGFVYPKIYSDMGDGFQHPAKSHSKEFTCLTAYNSHSFATGDTDGSIALWDGDMWDGKENSQLKNFIQGNKRCTSIASLIGGRFLVTSHTDPVIRIWDIHDAKMVEEIPVPHSNLQLTRQSDGGLFLFHPESQFCSTMQLRCMREYSKTRFPGMQDTAFDLGDLENRKTKIIQTLTQQCTALSKKLTTRHQDYLRIGIEEPILLFDQHLKYKIDRKLAVLDMLLTYLYQDDLWQFQKAYDDNKAIVLAKPPLGRWDFLPTTENIGRAIGYAVSSITPGLGNFFRNLTEEEKFIETVDRLLASAADLVKALTPTKKATLKKEGIL